MRSHYKQATIDAKPDIDFNGDVKLFITILFTIIGCENQQNISICTSCNIFCMYFKINEYRYKTYCVPCVSFKLPLCYPAIY